MGVKIYGGYSGDEIPSGIAKSFVYETLVPGEDSYLAPVYKAMVKVDEKIREISRGIERAVGYFRPSQDENAYANLGN